MTELTGVPGLPDLPTGSKPISNKILLRYIQVVAFGLVLVHLTLTVFEDNKIGIFSTLILGAIAIFSIWFQWHYRKELRLRAYSGCLTNLVLYLLVNGSYALHALILIQCGSADKFDHLWQGAVITMPLVWGVGMLFTILGSLLGKGYPDATV